MIGDETLDANRSQQLLIFYVLLLAAAQQYVRSHSAVDAAGCWIANTSGDGRYKHFWFFGERFKSHVLAWLAFRGSIRRHEVVDHEHCDNPSCCNPQHLSAKTQSENMKRCFAAGRGRSPFLRRN